jgi:thymidine kinase
LLENIIIAVFTAFWFSSVPVAFLTLIRFLRNRDIFIGRNLQRIKSDPLIIFQITTRSATKTAPVVKRGIDSIIRSCQKIKYKNYRILVVTDDPDDTHSLSQLDCKVLLVDKKFQANAIRKGRALHYAVDYRRKVGENTPEYWIFHMDEESYVTSQTILSLLEVIGEKGRIVIASEGPIFYPLKLESANFLTAIAESVRPFTCYHCVSHMTNPPPMHMHGSNLLVRSDIEDSIGWNFGPTLAEDEIFGYKIYEKYGSKSLGWHGGVLLEQPPLNIKDHFMQRRRWILGRLQNIARFPLVHRFKITFELITYFLVFVCGIISPILFIYSQILLSVPILSSSIAQISYQESNLDTATLVLKALDTTIASHPIIHTMFSGKPIEITMSFMLLFSSTVWLLSYQVGLLMNLRYSRVGSLRRVLFHLQALILCPVIGVVETFPAFCAIIEYHIKNRIRQKTKGTQNYDYDFYVVNK